MQLKGKYLMRKFVLVNVVVFDLFMLVSFLF